MSKREYCDMPCLSITIRKEKRMKSLLAIFCLAVLTACNENSVQPVTATGKLDKTIEALDTVNVCFLKFEESGNSIYNSWQGGISNYALASGYTYTVPGRIGNCRQWIA